MKTNLSRLALTSLLFLGAFTSTCLAADPEPQNVAETGKLFSDRMAAHQKVYSEKLEAIASKMKKESEQNKDDQDDAGKSGVKLNGHFENRLLEYVLNLPEVRNREQKISIDVPVVKFEDKGVSLNVPVIVMRRVPGPDISYPSLEWRNDGFLGTPSPRYRTVVQHTSYDVPVLENRLQDYVLKVPVAVGTERTEISIMVPEVVMKEKRVSFNFPVFIADNVQLGSPDRKRQKKIADRSEEQKISNDAAMKAAHGELTASIKSEMAWYAPTLVIYSGSAAVAGLQEKAKDSKAALMKALQDDIALQDAQVKAGDPRRTTTQAEINKHNFLLATLTTSANSALFESYKATHKALVSQATSMGMTQEELESNLLKGSAGAPGEVDYRVKYGAGGRHIMGR